MSIDHQDHVIRHRWNFSIRTISMSCLIAQYSFEKLKGVIDPVYNDIEGCILKVLRLGKGTHIEELQLQYFSAKTFISDI